MSNKAIDGAIVVLNAFHRKIKNIVLMCILRKSYKLVLQFSSTRSTWFQLMVVGFNGGCQKMKKNHQKRYHFGAKRHADFIFFINNLS